MKRKSQATLPYKVVKRSRLTTATKAAKYRRRIYGGQSNKPLISPFAQHPFPPEWSTKITWDPPCATLVPASTNGAAVIRVNSIYDPDYSNLFGNGQPLFTDEMMSATGPYQRFRVNGWKCKFEIINHSPTQASGSPMPVDLYLSQGGTDPLDVDTFTELQSTPGVMTHLLGHSLTGNKSYHTWYINGRLKNFIPGGTGQDDDYTGAYNADPAKAVYLSLAYANATPTDSSYPKLFVKVSIEFDVTFYARDAVSS